MSEGFPTIAVADLLRSGEAFLQTGPFGTQLKASEYVDIGIPVINVRNVGFGEIRPDDLEYVTEAKAEQLHHHVLRRHDIVFGRKGAVERHALIGPAQDGWVQGSDCLRLRFRTNRFDPRFVSYFLRTHAHQDWMQALCSFGATMASLNQGIVARIQVPAPEIELQRKIAAILSAYDEQIANNQRRIVLLESMAEEIFREWFVRKRFPGWAGTATHKGIPNGWFPQPVGALLSEQKRSVKLADLATIDRYVGLEHISRRSVALSAWGSTSEVASDKLRFSAGDILFGKIRPYLHKVALAHFDGACSTDTIVLRPQRAEYAAYGLFTVFSETFIDLATTASKGTKMPRADWHFLKRLEVLTPSVELLKAFQACVDPMFDQAVSLLNTNRLLAETRDALLPRLISGKLRVDALDICLPPGMREEAEQASSKAVGRAVSKLALAPAV